MKRLFAFLLALLLGLAFAQDQNVAYVPMSKPLTREQERQVQRIGDKLHCPICSGESITQSQTDISRQMLNEVRKMVAQGKSEAEILQVFVTGYGERILMEPPKKGINWLLWTLPAAFLLLGGLLWWQYLQRVSTAQAAELSEADEQRIQQLLAERQERERP